MDKLKEACCGKKSQNEETKCTRRSKWNPCWSDTRHHHPIPKGGPPLQIYELRRGSCDPRTGAPKPGCHIDQGEHICHKYAYVTLATNDTYALGCLVLGESLRRVQTQHETVVMVTRHVSSNMKAALFQFFNYVVQYDILDSKDAANLALLERPELGVTFTKLHCWTLTAYQKAVFLDADTMVVRNCDEIFENYDEFSATPDIGWPDCFNSGVFVYTPSMKTYETLINFTKTNRSFDGGDQGILNMFFNDWPTADIKKHLPFIYNMVASINYSYRPAFRFFSQSVKIVHFLGAKKPWNVYYDVKKQSIQSIHGLPNDTGDLVKFWWKIFMEGVLPQIGNDMAGDASHIINRCREMFATPDSEHKETSAAGEQNEANMDTYADVRSIILAEVS
ncbi:glycogenin-1-like [Paramacrobiotus metropolitanus]|uniref:glycogenin-1-like n=1 Tax=Paramacrobiotus metropolitanus TaxID=2943436 RepID=UPI002445ED36|nr:glycogenin-1-like [Paramacrobiotus metropolitanus]